MYGLIEKLVAKPGQRDALIAVLGQGYRELPGCLSYVVAKDGADADAVWVTEVWDSQASQRLATLLPAVRQADEAGRLLIASFGGMSATEPAVVHGMWGLLPK